MNERVVPKMTNFCVVKLSNSPAITCVPGLEPGHFELQPDSLRIDQRLPKQKPSAIGIVSPDYQTWALLPGRRVLQLQPACDILCFLLGNLNIWHDALTRILHFIGNKRAHRSAHFAV